MTTDNRRPRSQRTSETARGAPRGTGGAARAVACWAAGEDLCCGRTRWGLGVALDTIVWPMPASTAFRWGGYGGSRAVMDPKSRTSLGYAPNSLRVLPLDPRIVRLKSAMASVIQTLTE